MTALYFHGLSIKEPTNKYDITIKRGYHNKKLLEHNCFIVNKEIFELERQYVETPMGNKVKAYDIERCICDIIKSKNRMDLDHVKYSVRQYIKRKDKNLTKLSMYAEKLGIKEEVMNFIELMYEQYANKKQIEKYFQRKNIDFNTLLRLYMYDRFIERLSVSKYKHNFILKGGFYLSTFFGIENRNTMDIDTALKMLNLLKKMQLK